MAFFVTTEYARTVNLTLPYKFLSCRFMVVPKTTVFAVMALYRSLGLLVLAKVGVVDRNR